MSLLGLFVYIMFICLILDRSERGHHQDKDKTTTSTTTFEA